MKPLALSVLALLVLLVSPGWARQESLTPDEKQKLEKIDKVLVDVIALSDKESTDAGPFQEVVTKRRDVPHPEGRHVYVSIARPVCEVRKPTRIGAARIGAGDGVEILLEHRGPHSQVLPG